MNSKLRPLVALAIVAVLSAGCAKAPAESANDGHDNSTTTARAKAVKFAECMRDNGVSGFPDPDASGELTVDGVVNGSSVDPESSAWKKAIAECKSLQPPGFTGRKRSAKTQKEALEFAQCIRDNGVKDFPDPVEGEPLVNTNLIPSANKPGGMTILNAAMHTCGKVYAGKLGLKGP